MKRHHIPPILALGLGLLAACGSGGSRALPFSTESVRAVAIERLDRGAYTHMPMRDTLAADHIEEFVEGLRGAQDKGVGKVYTNYRITFTLDDGSAVEIRATEMMFAPIGKDHLYAFNGGRYFLPRYFPMLFRDTVGVIQNI